MEAATAWELLQAVAGWKRAHGSEDAIAPPSDAEHDALMAKYG